MKNPYLLFRGSDYYPSGGIDDLVGSYETLTGAIEASNPVEYLQWAHIVFAEEDGSFIKLAEIEGAEGGKSAKWKWMVPRDPTLKQEKL